jgi:hypothetical protein
MKPNHVPDFSLQSAARESMVEHGFEPEFPAAAVQQLSDLQGQRRQLSPAPDTG